MTLVRAAVSIGGGECVSDCRRSVSKVTKSAGLLGGIQDGQNKNGGTSEGSWTVNMLGEISGYLTMD